MAARSYQPGIFGISWFCWGIRGRGRLRWRRGCCIAGMISRMGTIEEGARGF